METTQDTTVADRVATEFDPTLEEVMRDVACLSVADQQKIRSAIAPKAVSLRPYLGRLIVKRDGKETKTAKGLHLPQNSKDKPAQGTVHSVGPGDIDEKTGENRPIDIKVGETVLFSKYAGTEVKIEGTEYIVLQEKDVLAIF